MQTNEKVNKLCVGCYTRQLVSLIFVCHSILSKRSKNFRAHKKFLMENHRREMKVIKKCFN